mgnify:CR=1 FL=1
MELFSIKKPFIDTDFNLPAEEIVLKSGLRYMDHIVGEGSEAIVGNTVKFTIPVIL